ncbi:class I SAM-dependent methyltransferase [Bacillus sp. 165]|uniref:class I SAM-dependent methyltransferase n=1 Tax=Bacillus sp. 165 TaxID=1529117 RepID=UPI001ADA4DEF|nr:class I SAM-dependent methyltransferase [Bacillus sp. 165]MBO9129364.1 class I SAM-dependent methyltransferase [Bacillus sp. 165]
MIITTAGKTNENMITYAKDVAAALSSKWHTRNEDSVADLHTRFQDDVLVVGKNRLEIYPYGAEESFFFHPNSSMFRVKRLMRGEHDPFIDAAKLKEGMSFLDCTLGMASDSIVASFVVGEKGSVTGIEANPFMAFLVSIGLQKWDAKVREINEAMKRIQVIQSDHLMYLQTCPEHSIDVIYLDPMFDESILESDGIRGLKHFALYDDITEAIIAEAMRVAKRRVVLKDHFRSPRFQKYGFHQLIRRSSKFHYGFIEKLVENSN